MADSATTLQLTWSKIVEVLSQNGIRTETKDSNTEILRECFPTDSLTVPVVDFWFSQQR